MDTDQNGLAVGHACRDRQGGQRARVCRETACRRGSGRRCPRCSAPCSGRAAARRHRRLWRRRLARAAAARRWSPRSGRCGVDGLGPSRVAARRRRRRQARRRARLVLPACRGRRGIAARARRVAGAGRPRQAPAQRRAAGGVRLLEGSKNEIMAAMPPDFAGALSAAGLTGLAAAAEPARPAPKPAAAAPKPRPRADAAAAGSPALTAAAAAGEERLEPLAAVARSPLAIVLWLLSRWCRPAPEPVVEAPAPRHAVAAAPAPAPEPAPHRPLRAGPPSLRRRRPPTPTPAPAETAATPDNPLMVGGVDIGAPVTGVLDEISGSASAGSPTRLRHRRRCPT